MATAVLAVLVPAGSAGAATQTVRTAAAAVRPAVVDITTTLAGGQGSAAGTGMVLSSSGLVLTNNHVIEGAATIKARDVGNGRTYTATVVGYDRTDDVAVLRLTGASGLRTMRFSRTPARLGQTVVAVGNAYGRGGTPVAVSGRVTALGRTITASDEGVEEVLRGVVQTDAAIVPGDSGGPLVNLAGQVLGMDTAGGKGPSGSAGFAVPIARAMLIEAQIVAGRSSATVHVGPSAMLGIGVVDGRRSGALVQQVTKGGPAAAAGISVGDTVTWVAGHAVSGVGALGRIMSTLSPGTSVSVRWVDAHGSSHSARATLAVGAPQ
ncbi:S1-C subfamily serine protease [Motilibacter rhizosphaerae]|uniref:S1-C subfamily serine protease n=1 Tax=Motilibacter rhizosphaerae TaxID=598652 RepID=A0A4V2F501_9ACTN|nr:trypsin-like peptidase domain-containing protein [Motilibacter rhizosphaerae]RZS91099.1 S1-C subfamily serine protease [Motilibacter rhizosphaerae]